MKAYKSKNLVIFVAALLFLLAFNHVFTVVENARADEIYEIILSDPIHPVINQPVIFTAIVRADTEPYGYRWDFDNDGNWDWETGEQYQWEKLDDEHYKTDVPASYTYSNLGTYKITFSYKDSESGYWTSFPTYRTVAETSEFHVKINVFDYDPLRNEEVTISLDISGFQPLLDYEWELGDGTEITTSVEDDPVITHSYSNTGSYQVEVRIHGYKDEILRPWHSVELYTSTEIKVFETRSEAVNFYDTETKIDLQHDAQKDKNKITDSRYFDSTGYSIQSIFNNANKITLDNGASIFDIFKDNTDRLEKIFSGDTSARDQFGYYLQNNINQNKCNDIITKALELKPKDIENIDLKKFNYNRPSWLNDPENLPWENSPDDTDQDIIKNGINYLLDEYQNYLNKDENSQQKYLLQNYILKKINGDDITFDLETIIIVFALVFLLGVISGQVPNFNLFIGLVDGLVLACAFVFLMENAGFTEKISNFLDSTLSKLGLPSGLSYEGLISAVIFVAVFGAFLWAYEKSTLLNMILCGANMDLLLVITYVLVPKLKSMIPTNKPKEYAQRPILNTLLSSISEKFSKIFEFIKRILSINPTL